MKKIFLKGIFSSLALVLVGLVIYFVNVEVQSYYGRQALAQADLHNHRLDEALKKATSENKLVLVEVAAIWCSTCRRLDNEVFANPQVRQKINEKFIFSRLEYESSEGTEFLKQHDAVGFPNLWILDGDGKTLKKLSVTFDPADFLWELP